MMLPAISLHQPYASLIAYGLKPYETRGWPPPARLIGKRIAIHAAKRAPHLGCRDPGLTLEVSHAFRLAGMRDAEGWWWTDTPLPIGAVVCTAVLAGAYRLAVQGVVDADIAGSAMLSSGWNVGGRRVHVVPADLFGDYSPGRWAWLLSHVAHTHPPIPAKGRQRWFTVEVPS